MRQFFTEDNDRLSMKRLCGFICTICLCVELFHRGGDTLVTSIAFISAGYLGLTTAEKIFKK
jgi:hypothetical protein